MSRRGLTFLVAGVVTLVLVVLGAFLPVPYVVLVPGPVTDTLGSVPGSQRPVVSVSGAKTFATSGHLYLTTVGVVPGSCDDQPTLFQALRAWFDHTEAVEPQQVICPPGESSGAVQQQNEQDMTRSQRDAVTAALLELGYTPTSQQVLVGDVTPKSPAAKVLRVGDALLAVDGQQVTSADRLRALIGARPAGSRLSLTIDRGGQRRTVSVSSVSSPGPRPRPIIGITPDLHATFKGVNVSIGIDPAQVGGPSAGLAFTLGIVDKMTPGSLTGGRTVAGTGTIDGFGHVGPIGGIQQKIAAAVRAGASVFLAPAGDCADAKTAAPSSLTLVRVETLHTALEALRAIRTGSGSFPRC